MRPLRIAVVGAGYMGGRHAEKVAALAELEGNVRLSAVADVDLGRAFRLASRLGARAAAEAAAVFGDADAVVVAVPTEAHHGVVRAALLAGLDVLVEKPVAARVEHGRALLALARRRGRVLRVGHVEWFNPALPVIRENVRGPRFVEAQRLGPFTERALDVDVVRDLMIHDLDILQRLLGEEPDRIEAIGVRVVSDRIDVAHARLRYPGGCVASVTASRAALAPVRRMRVFQPDGFLTLDFLAQSASFSRRAGARAGLLTEELKVDPEDALLAQLRSFCRAARERNVQETSAEEALGALRTALRVLDSISGGDGRG